MFVLLYSKGLYMQYRLFIEKKCIYEIVCGSNCIREKDLKTIKKIYQSCR